MSILDKSYKLVKLDLVEKTYNDLDMCFSISDNETSDFYIQITKNLVKIDLSKFNVFLWVLKPDKTTESMTLEQNSEGLFYCNLTNKFKNVLGSYDCQIFIEGENTERVATRSKFSYDVSNDIMHQQNNGENPSIDIHITIYDDETGQEENITISNISDSELSLEEV